MPVQNHLKAILRVARAMFEGDYYNDSTSQINLYICHVDMKQCNSGRFNCTFADYDPVFCVLFPLVSLLD